MIEPLEQFTGAVPMKPKIVVPAPREGVSCEQCTFRRALERDLVVDTHESQRCAAA